VDVEFDHLHPAYGYDEHTVMRWSVEELRRIVGSFAWTFVKELCRALWGRPGCRASGGRASR
jgi:hypothetical protein